LSLLVSNLFPIVVLIIGVIWLLRRWGPEPGMQIFAPFLLIGSFTLIATIVSGNVIYQLDTLGLYLLLPTVLHFILIFPQPIRYIIRHPSRIWWMYSPFIIAMILFLTNSTVTIITLVVCGSYGIAILLAIVLKWVRVDVKYYPPMKWLIGMFVALVVMVIAAIVMINLANGSIPGAGPNRQYLWVVRDGLVSIGSVVIAVMGIIGYHRTQRQLGPSIIMRSSVMQ
jgi:hypothetical protein